MSVLLPGASHGDGIHADIHRFDGDAGVEVDHILDLAHNGSADCGDVDAVFHDDVQLDGHGAVIIVCDLDTLAHGLGPQEMHQPVSHAALGHALDAEAVGGGRAGDGGEHGVADGDLAVFGGDFYHSGLPFCGNGIITHDNMEYYILLSPGLQ